MIAGSVTTGSAEAGVIVHTVGQPPVMANAIVSTVGDGMPAGHSPATPPDGVLVLFAVIASRSVQTPSLAAVSAVLVTVMMAPAESDIANDMEAKVRNAARAVLPT
jgi:hypothetical protein